MSREGPLPSPPITHVYDLGTLSEAGDEITITAGPDDLEPLAAWLSVDRVERFEGTVTLQRLAPDRFLYEGRLDADIVQSCVVSLEPVPSHIAREFSRTLRLAPRASRGRRPVEEAGGALTLAAGEDETPEELDSPRFDLAGPLLEELVLGIEPYPRAAGVAFEVPEGAAAPAESPFAALKRLKEGGG